LANDFTAMIAAIDTVTSEIDVVIGILQNPNVNNNDQTQIDALTARLSAVGNALAAALPAPAEPAPVETRPQSRPPVEAPAETPESKTARTP
jgi:hypothetical protein